MGTADNAAQDSPSRSEGQLDFELTILTLLGFKPVIGAPSFGNQAQRFLS